MDGENEGLVVVKEECFCENDGVEPAFGGPLKEEPTDEVRVLPGFGSNDTIESSNESSEWSQKRSASGSEPVLFSKGALMRLVKLRPDRSKMNAEESDHVGKSRKDQLKKKTRIQVADDIIILQEVLALNPFKDNKLWDVVTDNARTVVGKGFVRRNVKDRVMYLLKLGKEIQPQRRSGTLEDYALRDHLLRDVEEMIDSFAQHGGNKSGSQRRWGASEENEETWRELQQDSADSSQHAQSDSLSKAVKEVIPPIDPATAASLSVSRCSEDNGWSTLDSQGNVEVRDDPDEPQDCSTGGQLSSNLLSPRDAKKKPSTVTMLGSASLATPHPEVARKLFTTRVTSSSGRSTPTSPSPVGSPKAKRRRKSSMQVDQLLDDKHEMELINAKIELLKQENEKKRLENEEKRFESLAHTNSKLLSLVEMLVKQLSPKQ